MRKLPSVGLIVILVSAACTASSPGASPGASGSATSGGTITFTDTAGGANFQKFFGEILPMASSELGFQIKYVPSTGAELQPRLQAQKAGQGDVDLVLIKPDVLGNMIQAAIPFETLTSQASLIPNLSLVDPNDLQEAFGVATTGRATPFWRDQFGIIYDSGKIPNPPKTWQEFFDRRNEWAGHIGMIRTDATSGGGRLMLRDFLIGSGVDFSQPLATLLASTSWKDALAKFSQFSQAMYRPLASDPTVLFQQFKQSEVWITEYAIDFSLWSRDQGLLPPTLKATVFDSGLYGGASYLVVPSNTPDAKKQMAYKLINWLLSPTIQVRVQTEMWEYMAINSFDQVPAKTWDTIPSWNDVKNKRIPLTNLDAFNWLKEHGMSYVSGS